MSISVFPLNAGVPNLQKMKNRNIKKARGSQEPVIAHLDQSCFH
jgi:hypothetical protein